jgi:hypothetical protein
MAPFLIAKSLWVLLRVLLGVLLDVLVCTEVIVDMTPTAVTVVNMHCQWKTSLVRQTRI